MVALRLAYRNIKGAGLLTWLNVAVLSIAYVLIVWHQGIFNGMLRQGGQAMIKDEIAGGQYWHKNYDPYDPFSYEDSHGPMPGDLTALIEEGKATPILLRQAAMYSEGRMQTVLLRGIEPGQAVLGIPAGKLAVEDGVLPVLIGRRLAKSISVEVGDHLTLRWRDVNGTFDALEGKIVEVMYTQVVSIDRGNLWVPLKELRKMTRMPGEATMVIVGSDVSGQEDLPGWRFRDQAFLLKDINSMVRSKRVSSCFMYALLLFLAMLAIFDTQVLAIFRRRKEIGTLIALGMTRVQVMLLFTLEGAMHGILALGVAGVYGIPLLILAAKRGMKIPGATESYGFALADRVFPAYTLNLVLITVFLIMVTVTVVSFVPTRRIIRLKPTEALKGKLA